MEKIMPSQYSDQRRREILSEVKHSTVRAVAKKYGLHPNTLMLWNNELNVYAPKVERFTDAQRDIVLAHAARYGIGDAADTFDLDNGTIIGWNNQANKYKKQPTYTTADQINVLIFARDNSVADAERQFHIPKQTIERWNQEHKIYEFKQPVEYVAYTPAQQQELLQRARKIWDDLPERQRSANRAFKLLAAEVDVTVNQLGNWNKKYKIIPSRWTRPDEFSADEIAAVQLALDASRGRVIAASHKSGVSDYRIAKMLKAKLVSFDKNATNVAQSGIRVGPNKKRKIGEIMAALLQSKSHNG